MASTRVLGGSPTVFNFLARANVILTVTDEKALFPKANLIDGIVSDEFEFNTVPPVGGTRRIDIDLNHVDNGGFETVFVGGLPSAKWAKYVGNVVATRDTAVFQSGVASLKLNNAVAGDDFVTHDIVVGAGDWMRLDAWARTASAAIARIQMQNLSTGMFLASNGSWSNAFNIIGSTTNSGWVNIVAALRFQVQTVAAGSAPEPTLRIFLFGPGDSLDRWYDNVYMWPEVDFASIHGHNIASPAATGLTVNVALAGDPTPTPTTVQQYFSIRRRRFYLVLTNGLTSKRYWAFIFDSTGASVTNPDGAIWLGEVVLGQSRVLTRRQDYGQRSEFIDPQRRESSEAGQQRALLLTSGARQRANVPFRYFTLAEFQEARDFFVHSLRGGANPLVLVPSDDDAEVCLYGHVAPGFSVEQALVDHRIGASIEVEEDPLPNRGP